MTRSAIGKTTRSTRTTLTALTALATSAKAASATSSAGATTVATFRAATWRLLVAHVLGSQPLGFLEHGIVTAPAPLHHCVSKLTQDELHRTHRIIVGRDDDVRQIGIAIRIEDADHRNIHASGFLDGVFLSTRIDDDDRRRQATQHPHAFEVAADLLHLAPHRSLSLLLVPLQGASALELLEFHKTRQPLTHGREVRQRTADPPLGHGRHAALGSFSLDHRANLLLGTQEQHFRTRCGQLSQEVRRSEQTLDGLFEVDNVNLVPFAVDVRLHLRVPPAGLMAIVDPSCDQFLGIYGRHSDVS